MKMAGMLRYGAARIRERLRTRAARMRMARPGRFVCTLPLHETVILSDGRITSCCLDPRGDNAFANVYRHDVVRAGKRLRRFRRKLWRDPRNFPRCAQCLRLQRGEHHRKNPTRAEREAFLETAGLPERLVIELTSCCNLDCADCPAGNGSVGEYRYGKQGRFLDVVDLARWLEGWRGPLSQVRLYNYGETFLHPDAVRFCAHLARWRPALWLEVATNMLAPATDSDIERIVRSQPNALIVSLHGADQASAARYMGPHTDFAKAMQNMQKTIRIRKELQYDFPAVIWKYLLFDWNDSETEMDRARALAAEKGIDYIGFEPAAGRGASRRFRPGSEAWARLRNSDEDVHNIVRRIQRSGRRRQ